MENDWKRKDLVESYCKHKYLTLFSQLKYNKISLEASIIAPDLIILLFFFSFNQLINYHTESIQVLNLSFCCLIDIKRLVFSELQVIRTCMVSVFQDPIQADILLTSAIMTHKFSFLTSAFIVFKANNKENLVDDRPDSFYVLYTYIDTSTMIEIQSLALELDNRYYNFSCLQNFVYILFILILYQYGACLHRTFHPRWIKLWITSLLFLLITAERDIIIHTFCS